MKLQGRLKGKKMERTESRSSIRAPGSERTEGHKDEKREESNKVERKMSSEFAQCMGGKLR